MSPIISDGARAGSVPPLRAHQNSESFSNHLDRDASATFSVPQKRPHRFSESFFVYLGMSLRSDSPDCAHGKIEHIIGAVSIGVHVSNSGIFFDLALALFKTLSRFEAF